MLRSIGFVVAGAIVAFSLDDQALCQPSSPWVWYSQQASVRLIAAPDVGVGDLEEKDFIWGDLDQDGDVDLICVRKQPWDTLGRRSNVLFMNEGPAQGHSIDGVLVDRTAQFASESDVDGDAGFLTPTNDRDVKLVDVNNDGWLDVVTAVTLSDAAPKHISHPRIYMNKGSDKNGAWLGLRHEDARIPQLAGIAPNGFPHAPRFNSVAVGDIDNDGAPDLYFADGDFGPPETFDFNNRVLRNVNGRFIDVTATAIPATAQALGNAAASHIVDLNLDGAADLIRHAVTNPGHGVWVMYNDPAHLSHFNAPALIYTLAPSDCSIGDLNNDSQPDIVFSDDGIDRYRLHTGVDPDQSATFIQMIFTSELGGDDGFAGESVIADLDADRFNDVIISDVDFTINGCNRRTRIFRNLGNAPAVTLQEQNPSVIPTHLLRGTHDAAVFDINGDGHNDIVLGRCTGISIWINQSSCPADIINSITGESDGIVNVNDLLAVINAWGTCPSGVVCNADVSRDGTVDVNDLLAVINGWGPCP